MKGLSKGGSLELLKGCGLNTPIFKVFRRPYNWQAMHEALNEFPGNISIRTWAEKKVVCPFFPNRIPTEALQIGEDLLLNEGITEIIFSEGIDPQQSVRCGRLSDLGVSGLFIEYFEGPGTVRDMDTKEGGLIIGRPISNKEEWERTLVSRAKGFFRTFPETTLEWSYYDRQIGILKQNLILWEAL